MTVNPLEMLSVGCAIGGPVLTAFAELESGEQTLTVPPIRAYIGTEHLEFDVTIRRLPPP
jgi:hypothetical protein